MPGGVSSPIRALDPDRFQVPVRDPVWKHVWLSEPLRDIYGSAPFLRLYRIKQLGPTELIYPGATHSRASHSVGVYALAFRLLRVLVSRGADRWVTDTGCASFLAAALLHDLGHFPYTHSLKELPLENHEALTAALMRSEPLRSLIGDSGGDPDMAAAIVSPAAGETPGATGEDAETVFFQSLLSGVLDPDKLDYLNRDAYYCGVPYGLQDTEYVLSRVQPDRRRGIVLDSESVLSVESVLFSKYLMYRSVYWHRQVRIATAMMKKSLYAVLRDKTVSPETLYSLDDEGLYRLLASLAHPDAEIGMGIRERRLYRILAEYRFNESDPGMKPLEDLERRSEAERHLSERITRETGIRLTEADVLIDIPERISFESDLFVADEAKPFSESSTVFNRATVDKFTASLRKVRIAVKPEIAQRLSGSRLTGENLAEWTGLRYTVD